MDIQQWLAATADRAPPPGRSSDDHHIPDAFRAHPQDREQRIGRSYRRKKRKRASSDSSIIGSRAQAAQRSQPSERARSAETADRVSEEASSAYSSPYPSPSPKKLPEKTYERRARHKTRPDRYEPKQRKQKGDRDAHKDRPPGKKRRKSHRTGDGGRTAGLVQSFQLKGGPKNGRLTIKPSATAGLFKHGRASAQVTGRGAGLPDLVFNEMRFLQQPTEHQDAPPDPADQQRSKKDRKRPNDGEISAYFGAKQPAHEQDEERQDAPPTRDRNGEACRKIRERDQRRHSTPPVELPSRPYLGFGSKGGPPDDRDKHSRHASYFSWSQSLPHEPPTPRRRRTTPPVLGPSDLSTKKPKVKPRESSREIRIRNEENGDEMEGAHQGALSQHGGWVQTSRAKGAALVAVYQPPAGSRNHGIDRRSTTKTTSQSLPVAFTKRPPDKQQQTFAHQTYDRYHTSDILKIHEHTVPPDPVTSAQLQPEKENLDPASSFSIDRLLDDARHLAVATADEAKLPLIDEGYVPYDTEDVRHLPKDYSDMVRLPVRGETIQTFMQPPRPSVSRRQGGTNSHTGQPTASLPHFGRQVNEMAHGHVMHARIPADRSSSFMPLRRHAPEDDEMLDDGTTFGQFVSTREPVYASVQQAEELVYGSRSNVTPGIYESQSEQHLGSEAMSHWEQHERTPSTTLLTRSLAAGRTFESEDIFRPANDVVVEDMSGFWKPNKLY